MTSTPVNSPNSLKSLNTCQVGNNASLRRNIVAGMIGGVAGGVVFGLMMAKMGMLGMIASMMGSESVMVGAAIHMMISVMFGAAGGAVLKFMPSCPGKALLFSAVYGVVLWVVGPLMAMPMMMGQPLFQITPDSMMSLNGHVLFGVVTLMVARLVVRMLPARQA